MNRRLRLLGVSQQKESPRSRSRTPWALSGVNSGLILDCSDAVDAVTPFDWFDKMSPPSVVQMIVPPVPAAVPELKSEQQTPNQLFRAP